MPNVMYRAVPAPVDHPRGHMSRWTKSRWIQEHILVAERALGKYLPAGAEVHHVDGDGRNNAPSNLVICQDRAYHKLLHARARVVQAGGNPNTERICGVCREVLPLASFNKNQRRCRECQQQTFRKWWKENRA